SVPYAAKTGRRNGKTFIPVRLTIARTRSRRFSNSETVNHRDTRKSQAKSPHRRWTGSGQWPATALGIKTPNPRSRPAAFRVRMPFGVLLPTLASLILFGCGAQPGVNIANSGTSNSNTLSNTTAANSANSNLMSSPVIEAREPNAYQATVTLKFEAIGGRQNM